MRIRQYPILRVSWSRVSLVVFLFVSFLMVRGVLAQSNQQESAARAAELALKEIRESIENSSADASWSSLGGKCSGGVLSGKNAFGEYEATPKNASGSNLSCGSSISKVASIEVKGYFQGEAWTIGGEVHSEWQAQGQPSFRCTGSLPDNTDVYSGDDENLIQNLSWEYVTVNSSRKCEYTCKSGSVRENNACVQFSCSGTVPSGASRYDAEEEEGLLSDAVWHYSPSDTSEKCQYRCDTGYSWSSGVCASDGGSPTSEPYVTTGDENQQKQGAFGVQGAFKTYGGIDAGGSRIENVALPVDDSDIATKAYVDDAIQKAFGQ